MTRLRFALSGILAAIAGMAVGHLVAAFIRPASSPVLAIGSTVIDLTPTPLKQWAIEQFGTNDKLVLQGSVIAGTVILAAVGGLLAQRSRILAVGVLTVLVGLAGLAALLRPAAGILDAVPALATLGVAAPVLIWLAGLATTSPAIREPDVCEPQGSSLARLASRRGFLLGSAGVVVGSVAVAAIGQVRVGARRIANLVLPKPSDPAPPLPTGLEGKVEGISQLQTPTEEFYRVDTNLTVPQVDVSSWRLTIDGMVDKELTFTFDDLAQMPLIERDITMTCVSNEVGGEYVGAARWLGVPLRDILDRAGVQSGPDQILSTAVDGFTISTPLAVARDGRDAMVAIGMNGDSLTAVHGFPARLITPGLYGFVGATKWLTSLTLTTYAKEQAYWTKRKWATDAPIKTSARIDTPAPLSTIKAGRTAIGGVAWAQHRGVGEVEVSVDGGKWRTATLGPDVGVDYWRQWYLPWDATAGLHRLAVRATDRKGDRQITKRAEPFPSGSSGIQEIAVTVE